MSLIRKLLVVEDEFVIAEDLCDIVHGMGHEVVAVVGSVSKTLEYLAAHPLPDLVLLDVTLRGERDGIDLANQLRAEYGVPFLFITSSADGLTIARIKKTQPLGYLVKPFKEAQVRVTLEMVFEALAVPPTPLAIRGVTSSQDYLFVRDRKQLIKVRFDDLLWLEAYSHTTFLHTVATKHTLNTQLKQVEKRLPAADFIRVHRSYIVALRKIVALDGTNVVVGSTAIPVGRAYKDHLMGRLNFLRSL